MKNLLEHDPTLVWSQTALYLVAVLFFSDAIIENIMIIGPGAFLFCVGYNVYLAILKGLESGQLKLDNMTSAEIIATVIFQFVIWGGIFAGFLFAFLLALPVLAVYFLTFYTIKYMLYELTGYTGITDDDGSG